MRSWTDSNNTVIALQGRIDSTNAHEIESEILNILKENDDKAPVFDMSDLSYISSAGLRVLMKVAKLTDSKLSLTEVSPEVYDILDVTGFTELFKVRKKMREISVDDLQVIGKGFYGTVYRIDSDTIVKVYDSPDAIHMIENEKKMAKMAFLKGVPTAISFDIVKVGNSYGSVFELLNAKTFNDLLIDDPDKFDEILEKYVILIKQVHSTEAERGELPAAKDIFFDYLDAIEDYVSDDLKDGLHNLIESYEEDCHLIHGDFQMKNVMLTDDEPMLIDMDTLATGQPVFDLQGLYVTYQAFKEDEPDNTLNFLGITGQMSDRIWQRILSLYYDTEYDNIPEKTMNEIRILAYIRFLYIIVVSDLKNCELGKLRIRHCVEHLTDLIKNCK
ncbi:MAG: anti-sigma factor antagonist [Lachnospiraceae bacterium]|nr:anti-sigma factor antagonist [Lachnospiraceae bacterium]